MTVKVLYLPLNYGPIIFTGVYDAFRQAGCHLDVFDYFYHQKQLRKDKSVRALFLETARNTQPDLIHMQIQHTTIIDSDTVKLIKNICPKAIISNLTIDIRNYIQPTFLKISKHANYNFITSTGQLQLYKNAGVPNVRYWQVGYDPENHFPEPGFRTYFDYDVTFIGHVNEKEGYPDTPTRFEACNLLRDEFGDRFCLHGDGWPRHLKAKHSTNQRDSNSIYHNSVCCLSISHFQNIENYFSDRLLLCLASGRPTISLKFPGWESFFTNMCDIIMVDSVKEIPDKVRMLKNDLELADYIGKSGARKVFSEHTYLSRINELLDIVGLRGKL